MAIEVLTPEQLAAMRSQGKANEAYVKKLMDIKPGGGGRVTVKDEKVSRQTVKNRIKSAATQLNVPIRFLQSSSDTVLFQVMDPSELKPRRGRPRKTAQPAAMTPTRTPRKTR